MDNSTTGKEDSEGKEFEAPIGIEMQETTVTASSVQEGVMMDSGIDNPAFSSDEDKTLPKEAGEEDEAISSGDTSPTSDEKSPPEDTDRKEGQEEKGIESKHVDEGKELTEIISTGEVKATNGDKPAPAPATMEVTSVQMDTRTNVVSTHKEERVTAATGGSIPDYDRLVDADNIWVTDSSVPVKLRLEEAGPAAERPQSVPSVFIDTVRKAATHTAMATKVDNEWRKWTYLEYLQDVKAVAKSYINLGLEPSHGVAIIGFNSPEWFIAHLGAIFAGGMGVGVYTTNSAELVEHILIDSNCNIAVVEDDAQLQKVLKVRDNLPNLKATIQYRGSLKAKYENVYSWADLMARGKSVSEDDLEARIRLSAPNKCCTIIYTSGATGNPKGVMLSQDAVTWTSRMAYVHCKFRWMKEVSISYLPLSHIAAQLMDIFLMIVSAGTIYFAQPDALKGSLGVTIREVRPTQFFGVPRVWEKMNEKMRALGKQNTGIKKKIADWAKRVGLEGNRAYMNGRRRPFSFLIARALVFKKLKKRMGFDRCMSYYSGAAPISKDTLDYFLSLDFHIIETYGMSETSGPHHIATYQDFKVGTVGPTMPGVTTVLKDKDADGNGEICFWGRNLFMGYLNNEEKTREAVDEEGYLHSGDIGKWDDTEHHLSITGRIKEILITAGGENVAPVPIEENVKSELMVVSNCMLIGDKQKFLCLLITLKVEVNLDTMVPDDKLSGEALEWVASVGGTSSTVSQILDSTDVNVMRGIQAGIERANQNAPSRAQRIQKWTILPVDFSLPGGELTPTMKLKRPVVLKRYAKTIDAFYKDT